MHKKTIINWIILLILSMIWGSSFILMKKGLEGFNYLEVSSFRLIIAFITLSPFLISSLKNMKSEYVLPILVVSIIGTVIPAILFAFGQTYLNSSTAGMLNSLTPIFTLIIGITFFQKLWNKASIIGILIGLIGSYILMAPSSLTTLNNVYGLLIILATMCYAISINTIKERLTALNSLDIAVLTSFISFLIPFIFVLSNGFSETIIKIRANNESFYYLIILGTICTSFAIILFNYLIKRSSALFGSTTTYLIPVFAIIWGLIDNENIKNHEILGVCVILIGVMIMNYTKLE